MSDSAIMDSSVTTSSTNSSTTVSSSPAGAVPAAPKKTLHWVVFLIVVPWILAGMVIWVGRLLVGRGG